MGPEISKMAPGKVVRFVYLSAYRERARPKPHWQRDESAAYELIVALCGVGGDFVYEGPDRLFINSPRPEEGDSSIEDLRALCLCEKDVLLLTTRPPLDDDKWEEPKPLRLSDSMLERQLIVPILRERFFRYCTRGNVTLQETVASSLEPGFHDRSHINFSERTNPSTLATGTYYRLLGKTEREDAPAAAWNEMMTAGYLLNVPLGAGLPNLFAVFGMSGTTTLALAYLLTKRPEGREVLARAIRGPSFTMVEIQTRPISGELVGYGFCDSWDMRVIASC